MAEIEWKQFDYDDKKATAPPAGALVWIVETFYVRGVTLGYFDGVAMRTWRGSDDCEVTHWAAIEKPAPPRKRRKP